MNRKASQQTSWTQLAFVNRSTYRDNMKIHCSFRYDNKFLMSNTDFGIIDYDFEPSHVLMAQDAGKTFEATAPDASILIGFGVVVLLSIVAAIVWANEVVPVSRTKLALSKRDGEVRKYLDELKEGANGMKDLESVSAVDETDFETVGITSNRPIDQQERKSDGRDFERWLFTDWLENNKSAGKPGRKKEPALPILKKAKWNSGDNPVLVTFAMMMVGVLIAAITEHRSFT